MCRKSRLISGTLCVLNANSMTKSRISELHIVTNTRVIIYNTNVIGVVQLLLITVEVQHITVCTAMIEKGQKATNVKGLQIVHLGLSIPKMDLVKLSQLVVACAKN